ncbi:mechanosensitive ion channel domain-containing protein [Pseudomonas sp. DR48]|uniref:mechanosensitive ion channel domain-containing protein n=1 Tax=Pseudomonas sp. DR48 TaxID=2871095 RepID=UPI001C99673D|nr:mechanosensitive ion channel family protein [Pseudomonas sp. DR48]QZP31045.1 mechanosensitive ion channel [Pseudomonas sp. DR48]
MDFLAFSHPLVCAGVVLVTDLVLWRMIGLNHAHWRTASRSLLFALYSTALLKADLMPLTTIPDKFSGAEHAMAVTLGIAWWLFGARAITGLMILALESRIERKGHLLQDLIGAGIFLIAIVAAAAYVLDLPVKGLLATSGAVAIIFALAVQSTLADVFSGIVLNATKPFRVGDVINIDGVEGKVVEIDWRSTYLLTSAGSLVVIPNAMAAKTRIINLSRPDHFHPVILTIELPVRLRPASILDSLHKALKGCRELMLEPEGSVVVKKSGLRSVEYEVTGYVKSRDRRSTARNQLYDLIYRQLAASEAARPSSTRTIASTRQSAALDSVNVLRTLPTDDRKELERHMRLSSYPAGAAILQLNVIPDALLIVESGVVTVTLERVDGPYELGRMGPGEIMGEGGLVDQSPTVVIFTALTDCVIFRIDRLDLEERFDEHSELRRALTGLARTRTQVRETLLQYRPSETTPAGLLHWFRGRVARPRDLGKHHHP